MSFMAIVALIAASQGSLLQGCDLSRDRIGRNASRSLSTQWALTKEEMKNCVWLKPELVAQIEFTEWTPDGHLRHSKFVGLREDKDAREIVREIEG
jgi:ATP-dependent DNA ligase